MSDILSLTTSRNNSILDSLINNPKRSVFKKLLKRGTRNFDLTVSILSPVETLQVNKIMHIYQNHSDMLITPKKSANQNVSKNLNRLSRKITYLIFLSLLK